MPEAQTVDPAPNAAASADTLHLPTRRRRRRPPRPTALEATAPGQFPTTRSAQAAASAANQPSLRGYLRRRRPRSGATEFGEVKTADRRAPTGTGEGETAGIPGTRANPWPRRRPAAGREDSAGSPQAAPSAGYPARRRNSRDRTSRGTLRDAGTGGARPRNEDRRDRDSRPKDTGSPRSGPSADGRRGRGRAAPPRRPEPKLYVLESVVDRGFEDFADESDEGVSRRIHWTIVKRSVADQKSGKAMSATYVLQRDGNDTEYPNLGAARAAANKTIVHPEKLTLSKAEHAAARKQ
jgi:hypothetical protein